MGRCHIYDEFNFKFQYLPDPQVTIRIIPLTEDIVTLSIISGAILALLVLFIVIVCWWMKSKYRQKQRLERRNSIRTSLHSLRSVGLTPGGFSDPGYRRKVGQMVRSYSFTNQHIDKIVRFFYRVQDLRIR